MNVLFGDVIQADTLEVTFPRSQLSSGLTHSSMHENVKALFESIDLEVSDWQSMIRMPVNGGTQPTVNVRLMSQGHINQLKGR